uniref:Arrestin-like N-terminal domain-containing protein n=1 Tax=Megaselia scalaris TaxID=36166 RepID=T1GGS9_MEGSC
MDFRIDFFDNPSKTYYPGEFINGCLLISVKRGEFIKNLLINIRGGVKVNYFDDVFHENFFDDKLLVIKDTLLEVGQHTFPFQTRIPEDCPPSLKSNHAYIKYKAVVVIPGVCNNTKIPFEFFVLSWVPMPFYEANVTSTANPHWPINKLAFPKNAFGPGEYINVIINVEEASAKTVKFYLMKYFWYKRNENCWGKQYKRKEKKEIFKIPIVTSNFTTHESLLLPKQLPSTLENFKFIEIGYILKIVIRNQTFKFPVVIGDYYKSDLRI